MQVMELIMTVQVTLDIGYLSENQDLFCMLRVINTQTTHRWCVIYATHILGIKGFKESYVFIVSSLELLYRVPE